ncbi:MAG: cell division protein FtsL [Pseudomonadota bacterium]
MRGFVLIPSILAVLGLAFWAYQENYRTQAAQQRAETLARDIGALRERLTLLEAEWAYLNRPLRLAALAELNFDRLKLQPFAPMQFGKLEEIAYPPDPTELIVDGIVEARGTLTDGVDPAGDWP